MDTKSTREVAKLLHVHQASIEQWISREQFLPRIFSKPGFGREWTFDEVMRLSVFFHLVSSVGISPKDAGRLTHTGITAFKRNKAFFVAYTVDAPYDGGFWQHEIVRDVDLGEFLTNGCHIPTLIASSPRGTPVSNFADDPKGPAFAAVIINLDEIEQNLKTAWNA